MEELSFEKFQDWLNSQPDDRMYTKHDCSDCPIACYYKDLGCVEIHVSYHLAYGGPDERTELPEWASKFIVLVDANHEFITEISNAECKNVLKYVKAVEDAKINRPAT